MNDAVTKTLMRIYRSSQPYVPTTQAGPIELEEKIVLEFKLKS
jgi:hypothetical protein